ncbi:MAG: hypothetical protein NVS4B3_19840 [Gemmatimonadaceae bacterium]
MTESALTTVFLDRDGVLNRKPPEGDYVKSPNELQLLRGAIEGVRLLNQHGLLVLVVTNQRGISLGRMSPADLDQTHAELNAQFAAGGASLDGIYCCPHALGACDCRKPRTGLFLQARRDHPEIDFACSALIGDSATDMVAAERIGARGILISSDPTIEVERATTLLFAARRLIAEIPKVERPR